MITYLSEELKQKARQEAIEYLEYSIYTMSVLLGIDIQEIDAAWAEKTEQDLAFMDSNGSDNAAALRCLVDQVKAYVKISS